MRSDSRKEKGMALVFALLLAVIIVGALTFGAQLLITSLSESHKQKAIYAQGEAIAKAGIADALSWFRRQQNQPVASGYPVPPGTYPDAAFYPREDTDTIDESTGLVKEELLTPGPPPIYARYEVKRQSVDNYTNPALTDPDAVHDITGQKLQDNKTGEGLVWAIQSTGYVYVKRDDTKKFNESPNEVKGRAIISTEFRRITIQLPTNSAVFIDRGGSGTRLLRVYTGGKVKGGTGAYGAVRRTGNSAYQQTSPSIWGSPSAEYNTSGLNITPERIFGVPADELKLMSDYLVDNVSKLPYAGNKELPAIGIYYIDLPAGQTATFNETYPLNTSGILFVNGNLEIQSYNPGVYFTGVIYVNNGTVTIRGPAVISGTLICNNTGDQYVYIHYTGSTGITEINYDSDIINSVRQQLTQYRENKAMYRVHSVLK